MTDKIYELSQTISEYLICPELNAEIHSVSTQEFTVGGKPFTVQVLDSVQDYMDFMKEIFDFPAIKSFITGAGGKPPLKVIMNALHGGKPLSLYKKKKTVEMGKNTVFFLKKCVVICCVRKILLP